MPTALYAAVFLDLKAPAKDHMEPLKFAWSGEADDARDAARKVFLSTMHGETLQMFHRMYMYVSVGIFHRSDFALAVPELATRHRSSP